MTKDSDSSLFKPLSSPLRSLDISRLKPSLEPSCEALALDLGHSSDTAGNPSETVNNSLLGAIRRELKHQLGATSIARGIAAYFNPYEPTLPEILAIERKVRRELYG